LVFISNFNEATLFTFWQLTEGRPPDNGDIEPCSYQPKKNAVHPVFLLLSNLSNIAFFISLYKSDLAHEKKLLYLLLIPSRIFDAFQPSLCKLLLA